MNSASQVKPGTLLRHRFIANRAPVIVTRIFSRSGFVEVDFGDGERGIVQLSDYSPVRKLAKTSARHPRAKLPLFKVDRFKQYPPRASEILKSADRQVYFPFEGRHGQPSLYYGDEAKTPDGAIQNGQKAVRQYQKDTWPGGMGEVVAIAYTVRNGKFVYRPVWNSYYSFS